MQQTSVPSVQEPEAERIEHARWALARLQAEIRRGFVGQDDLCRGVLTGLLAGGNVLIEGQPGLGKTLLVRLLADALALRFARIQFTPDLLPADITGTEQLVRRDDGTTGLGFRPGPIFAHLVLADEINRATPKTQSALLEAMQEHAVTTAGERRSLDEPFCVIATQNPIEMEGTYPLPEAQLDRFMLKVNVSFPPLDVLREIGVSTAGGQPPSITAVMTREALIDAQRLVRQIVIAPHVAHFAALLNLATHPAADGSPDLVRRYVRYGASPRAMQALLLAGRAYALLCGRAWVAEDDIRAIAHPVLRHRMIPSFDAKLEGITNNRLVDTIIASVPNMRAG